MTTLVKISCTFAHPQSRLDAEIQIWYHLKVAVVYPKYL